MPSTRERRFGDECALHMLAVSRFKTYMHPMQKVADTLAARPYDAERPTITGPTATSNIEDGLDGNTDAGHFTRWKHLRRPNFASRCEIVAHLRALRGE